jgi:hypothetical protein
MLARTKVCVAISAAVTLVTPVGAAAATSVFTASADAHVSAAQPKRNFGKASTLAVGGAGRARGYLRFALSDLSARVEKATVRLFVRRGAGAPIAIRPASSRWSERRLTRANAPRPGRVASRAVLHAGWNSLDVTPLVAGNGSVTLVLTSRARRAIWFTSRETGRRAPRLNVAIVDAAPAPIPQPSPPTPIVLLAAGDISDCGTAQDEATATLLDGLTGTIAALGDTVYETGTPEEYANCYEPTWGRHKARTRPVPGNHEYDNGLSTAAGFFGYFGTAAGEPDKGYYSYDLGVWHIVALNSNSACTVVTCDANSAQEDWLRADLAAHPTQCTLAYLHHPLFSANAATPAVQALWDALYELNADVILAGHSHTYQRFAPQTPAGTFDPQRGIRQFVVGTGGRRLHDFTTPAANTEAWDKSTFGVLQLTLRTSGYDWRFMPVAGQTYTDSGSGSCH